MPRRTGRRAPAPSGPSPPRTLPSRCDLAKHTIRRPGSGVRTMPARRGGARIRDGAARQTIRMSAARIYAPLTMGSGSLPAPLRHRTAGAIGMRRRTAETIAVAGAVLALLLARNLWVLRTPVLAEGDYGSNSLRIELAKHFEQLVGHYSRFGFDHPGPAYFYIQAASEWLFHDVVPLTDAPYNAQLLGILVLNSVLLATCAAIIALRTRSRLNALLFLAIVVLVVSAETGGFGAPGFLLAGNWTPHSSVIPFLTFLVAGASVLSGRFESLWIVALTGALLVHGYISF